MGNIIWTLPDKNNGEHLDILTAIVTEYNREILPEYTEQSGEPVHMLLNGLAESRGRCLYAQIDDGEGSTLELGFGWGQINQDGRGFVREIFVKPGLRRRGYGTMLYKKLEELLKNDGAKSFWLTAKDDVQPFWESVGYGKTTEVFPQNNLPVYSKYSYEIQWIPRDRADEKSRICRLILEDLPNWFGIPESIDEYVTGVREQAFWAVFAGDAPVGFLALREHNGYTAEIDVMGILCEHQHKGIGRQLCETAQRYSQKRGKSMLLVKTLDFAHPDVYYAQTRAYYLAMGFVPLQVLEGYWDECNPCLLLGKSLSYDVRVTLLPVGQGKAISASLVQWVKEWDWGAGKFIGERLEKNDFSDWETVFLTLVEGEKAGLGILEKRDDYAVGMDAALTPFITAVYTDPKYRGQRLGERMLETASNYARSLGFDAVYLISGEEGYYQKYGFEIIARTQTLSGREEPVYQKTLNKPIKQPL